MGMCPGCEVYLPHYLRPEADQVVAVAEDGERKVTNLQALCGYSNRIKGTQGKGGNPLKMAELRVHNVATGVMVDEALAVNTASGWPVIAAWSFSSPMGPDARHRCTIACQGTGAHRPEHGGGRGGSATGLTIPTTN